MCPAMVEVVATWLEALPLVLVLRSECVLHSQDQHPPHLRCWAGHLQDELRRQMKVPRVESRSQVVLPVVARPVTMEAVGRS